MQKSVSFLEKMSPQRTGYAAVCRWRWDNMWQRRIGDLAICGRGELERGNMWRRRIGDGAICGRGGLEMGQYVTEENWRWGNMWQRRIGDGAICDRGELKMGQYVAEENWRWGNMWQRRIGDGELCCRGELEMGKHVVEENWRRGNMWHLENNVWQREADAREDISYSKTWIYRCIRSVTVSSKVWRLKCDAVKSLCVCTDVPDWPAIWVIREALSKCKLP